MSEDYTFKKSTCERYDIRWKPYGWATITIDENGGVFNAQSDFGAYAYSWPGHGRKSFKDFIVNDLASDPSYFLGKVAKENFFDSDLAFDKWKGEIISIRRERECTREQAREAYDFLNDLDSSLSVDLLQERIYESKELNAIYDEPWYAFDFYLDFSPQAKAFAHIVMPMFAEILKKEIEEANA